MRPSIVTLSAPLSLIIAPTMFPVTVLGATGRANQDRRIGCRTGAAIIQSSGGRFSRVASDADRDCALMSPRVDGVERTLQGWVDRGSSVPAVAVTETCAKPAVANRISPASKRKNILMQEDARLRVVNFSRRLILVFIVGNK